MHAGPLCAVGLALFFAGAYEWTRTKLFADFALIALGAVMCAAAMAMFAKGVG